MSEITETPKTEPGPEPPKPVEPQPQQHKKTIEYWRDLKHTENWKFAAAKTYRNWPTGAEVTEADYDSAIFQVARIAIS